MTSIEHSSAGPIVGQIQRTEFNSEIRRLEESIAHNDVRDRLQELRWAAEIKHIRELIDQSEATIDKALVIRTAEIERRLTLLNHEYQRAAEERSRVVSADTWSEFRKEYDAWRTEVNDFKSNMQGRLHVIAGIYGLVLILIGLALGFLT